MRPWLMDHALAQLASNAAQAIEDAGPLPLNRRLDIRGWQHWRAELSRRGVNFTLLIVLSIKPGCPKRIGS